MKVYIVSSDSLYEFYIENQRVFSTFKKAKQYVKDNPSDDYIIIEFDLDEDKNGRLVNNDT